MKQAPISFASTWDRTVSDINSFDFPTPAFVYSEKEIVKILTALNSLGKRLDCKILFSLKSFAVVDALRLMVPMIDGFASSSVFEARLARQVLNGSGGVHMTSPGMRIDEIESLADLCDYISFNSLSQWYTLSERVGNRAHKGLRINPQISHVEDKRYDPCRPHSKLGVTISCLVDNISTLNGLSGIHVHTSCEFTSVHPLLSMVQHLDLHLGMLLRDLQWINLGGGYQYDEIDSLAPLYEAVELLRAKYDLEVFLEPGEAVVGNAGYIVSSIVDLLDSEGKSIAVLDTSINHMPQVFEYQYRPDVWNSTQSGKYSYILAGSSCLAGDLFGEYSFDAPLKIGSKIIFEFMGAYTLAKAHMFNGINLPTIYALNDKNELTLKRQYTFQDYISRWKETAL